MIKGTLQADGLAVLEILHAGFAVSTTMKARIAFVKSDTGATMGWTEHANWSKETLDKLSALRESMEHDVAKVYLSTYADTVARSTDNSLKGLADHLGGQDSPSV